MKTIFETIIKDSDRVIAIAGAGGKTSLMFLLAHAFQKNGEKVISTTTTRILHPSDKQSPEVIPYQEPAFFERLERNLDDHHHVTVASHILPKNKLSGLSCDELQQIFAQSPADRLIIEADGARGLSLKAPGENEPVVPEWADVFISMVGLDCIGKPLTEKNVFRSAKVAAITGLHIGNEITPATVATLAAHPQGLLKGCPKQARSFIFLNKTDVAHGRAVADQVIKSAKHQQGSQPDFWTAGSIIQNTLLYVMQREYCPPKRIQR
jgi:probable selenium-dependent hydroxylase accessory protein YqeC